MLVQFRQGLFLSPFRLFTPSRLQHRFAVPASSPDTFTPRFAAQGRKPLESRDQSLLDEVKPVLEVWRNGEGDQKAVSAVRQRLLSEIHTRQVPKPLWDVFLDSFDRDFSDWVRESTPPDLPPELKEELGAIARQSGRKTLVSAPRFTDIAELIKVVQVKVRKSIHMAQIIAEAKPVIDAWNAGADDEREVMAVRERLWAEGLKEKSSLPLRALFLSSFKRDINERLLMLIPIDASASLQFQYRSIALDVLYKSMTEFWGKPLGKLTQEAFDRITNKVQNTNLIKDDDKFVESIYQDNVVLGAIHSEDKIRLLPHLRADIQGRLAKIVQDGVLLDQVVELETSNLSGEFGQQVSYKPWEQADDPAVRRIIDDHREINPNIGWCLLRNFGNHSLLSLIYAGHQPNLRLYILSPLGKKAMDILIYTNQRLLERNIASYKYLFKVSHFREVDKSSSLYLDLNEAGNNAIRQAILGYDLTVDVDLPGFISSTIALQLTTFARIYQRLKTKNETVVDPTDRKEQRNFSTILPDQPLTDKQKRKRAQIILAQFNDEELSILEAFSSNPTWNFSDVFRYLNHRNPTANERALFRKAIIKVRERLNVPKIRQENLWPNGLLFQDGSETKTHWVARNLVSAIVEMNRWGIHKFEFPHTMEQIFEVSYKTLSDAKKLINTIFPDTIQSTSRWARVCKFLDLEAVRQSGLAPI